MEFPGAHRDLPVITTGGETAEAVVLPYGVVQRLADAAVSVSPGVLAGAWNCYSKAQACIRWR
jgi:hypothetical protein